MRYTDTRNKKEFASKKNLKYWTPIDWYNGGMEHTTLHLLYSRFWHKFLYDMKLVPTSEPYIKRTSHGFILAEGGEKMSKSRGNVVNPDEMVSMYGADTLRMYEMFIGPFDQTAVWSTESIVGCRRFIEKVWKISDKISKTKHTQTNPQILRVLNKTIKQVGEDIEKMGFNTAVSAMMMCANEMEKAEVISKKDFLKLVKVFSVFAPHISEEIWKDLGEKKSIHIATWPEYDSKFLISDTTVIGIQVNGKVRAEIEVSNTESEEDVKSKVVKLDKLAPWLEDKTIKRVIYIKGKIVSIVV